MTSQGRPARYRKTDEAEDTKDRGMSPDELEGLSLKNASPFPLQNLEIVEESVLVKSYSATCVCGRVFAHRDRRTLESNINQHLVRYHGADAEYRQKLEYVKREIGWIRKRLNRRYGR